MPARVRCWALLHPRAWIDFAQRQVPVRIGESQTVIFIEAERVTIWKELLFNDIGVRRHERVFVDRDDAKVPGAIFAGAYSGMIDGVRKNVSEGLLAIQNPELVLSQKLEVFLRVSVLHLIYGLHDVRFIGGGCGRRRARAHNYACSHTDQDLNREGTLRGFDHGEICRANSSTELDRTEVIRRTAMRRMTIAHIVILKAYFFGVRCFGARLYPVAPELNPLRQASCCDVVTER
jgi:hypothetical protein